MQNNMDPSLEDKLRLLLLLFLVLTKGQKLFKSQFVTSFIRIITTITFIQTCLLNRF